jgi:DNA repair protein RadC
MRIKKYGLRLDEDRFPMLIKENGLNYQTRIIEPLFGPRSTDQFFREIEDIDKLVDEEAFLLCLDVKLRPIGYFHLSSGSFTQTYLSIRDIFMKAVSVGATGIIVVHNHPSDDPTFSEADITVAKKIFHAGELMEITLLDFMAIGTTSYCSAKEEKLFEKENKI